MWMRLAAHADVGYVRGVDQAYYRVHGENMTNPRPCWWICAAATGL